MSDKNIAFIKAMLLSEGNIQLDSNIDIQDLYNSTGNIMKGQWIFIRISKKSRVRLTLNHVSRFILTRSNKDDFFIQDVLTQNILVEHVAVERIIAHAPEQLFFLLYKNCTNGCLFCPLTYHKDHSHYNWEKIQQKICDNRNCKIKSVSFTTSCPAEKTQNEIVNEMAANIIKTRELMGNDIPIGISLKTPSKEQLLYLKKSGATEVRLNIETYNPLLAKSLMPNKEISKILHSIEMAVDIYGKEKVSSNIIIGLGESDNDILRGVQRLSKTGALTTLYPFDPISRFDNKFKRPSAERIYNLAVEHNNILQKYNLNPLNAKTMCCQCAASHLYPGKDL